MAKILIVDDEPLVCEMLDVLLSGAGHEITTAPNGAKAMAALEAASVDLVILDIVMPEKDGLETIMELRETNPDLKVIAISGGPRIGTVDFLAAAKTFGAYAIFYKPLDNDELLAAVDKCLAETTST